MKSTVLGLLAAGVLVANASSVHAAPVGSVQSHHGPVKYLPESAAHLVVEGVKYWFSGGAYYRKEGNRYVMVEAPKGAYVRHLPNGSVAVKHKGQQYFHHKGIYYSWVPAAHQYLVVEPELAKPATYKPGSVPEHPPEGVNAMIFNGVEYFSFDGRFFLPTQRSGKKLFM